MNPTVTNLGEELELWQETLEQESYLPARIEAIERLVALWPRLEDNEDRGRLNQTLWTVTQEPESILRLSLALSLERAPESPERTAFFQWLATPASEPDEQVRLVAARCQGVAADEHSPLVQQAYWERQQSLLTPPVGRLQFTLEVPRVTLEARLQTELERSGQLQIEAAELHWELCSSLEAPLVTHLRINTSFPGLWNEMLLLHLADPTTDYGQWAYLPLCQVRGEREVGGALVLPSTIQEPIRAYYVSPLQLSEDDGVLLQRSRQCALLAEPEQVDFWQEWEGYLPFELPNIVAPEPLHLVAPGLLTRLQSLTMRLFETAVPRPSGATVRFAAPVSVTRIPIGDGLFAIVRPRGEQLVRVAVEFPEQEPGDLVLLQVFRSGEEDPDFQCLTTLRDGVFAEMVVDVPRVFWRKALQSEQEQRLRLVLLHSENLGSSEVTLILEAWEQEKKSAEARIAWRNWARRLLVKQERLADELQMLCLEILG